MIGMLALALAAAAPAAAAPDKGQAAAKPAQAAAQNCDARKFETTLEAMIDGKPRRSKVRICGVDGQSDADWVKTLKDAVAKTKDNDKLPLAMREQLIAALDAEIAKGGAKTAEAPAAALPPPRPKPQTLPRQDYAALPPLPAVPPGVILGAAKAPPQLPLLSRPRLAFACFTPGDLAGDGPCTGFERDTLLVIRAAEDVPAGTSLRFVRNGDSRADVPLSQLRKGKFVRLELPQAVCRGVVGGNLQIRIVRSAPGAGAVGQVVGSEGPYNLRC